ncbi:MAG: DUF1415 domain-containing protein [Rubrivivax sp.]|nr:DUF1415 domain-containing protein [Rubrivivax sp.]
MSHNASRDPIAATRVWLDKAVIGLNLCPFAKAVHGKDQIRWVSSSASTPQALLLELQAELQLLAATDPAAIDTTLIVHPQVLQDFLDFNDFLDVADQTLTDLDLDGVLQIASFHPDYRFADAAQGDMGHFSNRSPYPTLHLLREDSIARAVAAVPDAADIYKRNIQTLRALGADGWRRLFNNE